MEKSMLGHAGFFTSLPKTALSAMIDVVKAIEPDVGYGATLKLSEANGVCVFWAMGITQHSMGSDSRNLWRP
jgi:predicted molibdopterin-dependent oxidoreductase YjgC